MSHATVPVHSNRSRFAGCKLALLAAWVAFQSPTLMAAPATQPFDQVIVFGDSNSDVGRRLALEGIPASPYFAGRHSNGPVAVEYIAAALGQTLVASGPQTTDFAVGGALTSAGNVDTSRGGVLANTGLQAQLASFLFAGASSSAGPISGAPAVDPDALYFIWGGANDLSLCGGAACTWTQLAAIQANLNNLVTTLSAQGARHFMLVNQYGTNAGVQSFNASLAAGAQALKAAGTDVTYFDAAAVVAQMRAANNPYGFTHASAASPCYTGNLAGTTGTTCTDPQDYVTWDSSGHLTARANQILGESMVQALGISAVPEPTSWALLAAGLVAISLRTTHRRAAR